MKIRFKFTLFFTFLTGILILSLIYYLNIYFSNYFKNNTLNNLKVLAELSESSYFGFINGLVIKTTDWSSDGYIRDTVEDILKTPVKDRESPVKALNSYLKNEKIIYDPDVIIIDILDKDGLVLASSRDERVGVDEKKEELELGNVRFTEALQAESSQAFTAPIVVEKDEQDDPMIHLTIRIFSKKTYSSGSHIPLDAVMLIHFTNTAKLRDALVGEYRVKDERITSTALMKLYKTVDVYLVNKNGLMITPSRLTHETILQQKVNTEPVRACFERGEEIASEYFDYRGQAVFGASMCIKREGVVLVLEVETQEVLAPLQKIGQFLILVGGIAFGAIFIGIILLSRWLLAGLKTITGVAEEVSKNNFQVRAKINSKDEIGYLAKVFNAMLDSIEKSRQELEEAEVRLKVINASLEQRVKERTAELTELKIGLEKIVTDKTFELQKRLDELEKFKKLTIGRELKMIELKKEIESYKNKSS